LIDSIPDSAELNSRLITLLREKNIQRVDEAVNTFWHILEQMEESVRTLNKNAPNNIYVMRILKMITDFVISTGCDTIVTSTQKSYGKSIFQLLKDKLEKKYIANHG
jgi:exonuclease V gamma subunit